MERSLRASERARKGRGGRGLGGRRGIASGGSCSSFPRSMCRRGLKREGEQGEEREERKGYNRRGLTFGRSGASPREEDDDDGDRRGGTVPSQV